MNKAYQPRDVFIAQWQASLLTVIAISQEPCLHGSKPHDTHALRLSQPSTIVDQLINHAFALKLP